MKHPLRNRLHWLASVAALVAGACSGNVGSDAAPFEPNPEAAAPQTSTSGPGGSVSPGGGGGTTKVVTDANGEPVTVNENGEVVDENGDPVTDENGNPVTVPDATTPSTEPVTGPGEELTDCSTPGPRQVRRLTQEQYHRTLQAIFSDANVPTEAVLSDASVLGFHVDAEASVVRDLEGELLMNYAERVADWAIDNGKVGSFTSCTDGEQCRREFISNLGARAHREPLSEERIGGYLALFDRESTFDDGARAVISAMLQSPYTLYRREMGVEQGGRFSLSPHELASELSYWLTNGPPDAELYDAAANGRLGTTEDLVREASRLLETPEARETLAQFLEGWLHLDKLGSKAKDETILPLPAELRASMVGESRELFLHTFYENGTLEDLFTARHTYVDQNLSSFYGLGGAGREFQRVDMSGTTRGAGLLGHAAFLTTHALSDNSSPVQRAKVVVERLLCQNLPPVPSNVDTSLDTRTDFVTNRERYEQHRERAECASCHENLDPIGYAFEHFDGFGRYRDQENGVDIDASGSLDRLSSGPVALDGVDSLSQALATSPELESCLVRYWSYYTFGREGWADEACHRDAIVREARAEDSNLRSVLLGIVRSPHFATRVEDP